MEITAKVLVGVGALAFLLAVAGGLEGNYELLGIDSEGFSRACNNLVLIGIALILMAKNP